MTRTVREIAANVADKIRLMPQLDHLDIRKIVEEELIALIRTVIREEVRESAMRQKR